MKKQRTFTWIVLGLLSLGAGLGLAQNTPKQDNMQNSEMASQENHSRYLPYSSPLFKAQQGKKRVLFFAASWCPSCQGADKDLKANIKNIPEDVVVFRVDYDREKALKKMHNVTYQHTFVQVDAAGKAINTWSGGGMKELLARLK